MCTNSLYCHWCGVSLAGATSITYLNGNLPCCDLCLRKSSYSLIKPIIMDWVTPEEEKAWEKL